MPGLDPGIHASPPGAVVAPIIYGGTAWIPGSSPGMTKLLASYFPPSAVLAALATAFSELVAISSSRPTPKIVAPSAPLNSM